MTNQSFCSNCGGKLQDTKKFCPKCGHEVSASSSEGAGKKPTKTHTLIYTAMGFALILIAPLFSTDGKMNTASLVVVYVAMALFILGFIDFIRWLLKRRRNS